MLKLKLAAFVIALLFIAAPSVAQAAPGGQGAIMKALCIISETLCETDQADRGGNKKEPKPRVKVRK